MAFEHYIHSGGKYLRCGCTTGTCAALAAAEAAIFLSAGMREDLQRELLKGVYTAGTPAALVYKATWPGSWFPVKETYATPPVPLCYPCPN